MEGIIVALFRFKYGWPFFIDRIVSVYFYMTSSNHKIDVHDADTISVKAIGRPIMYMLLTGSGNEINLQANKDIY